MKRVAMMPFLCLTLAAGPVLAADAASEKTPASAKDRGTVEKTFEGKVTAYVPGRSLTIEMEGAKTHTFELGEKGVAASVAPTVEVGSHVRVVDSRDATGKRTVTVTLAAASAGTR